VSKDRDGFSDDENLAPGVSGADGMSAGSPSGSTGDAGDADDVLHDPETTAPDALDVEAEIEAAEESAGLEPGSSDDEVPTADATSTRRAVGNDADDAERVDSDELVGAGVGGGGRGRRGSVRGRAPLPRCARSR
jgi:hypothetical protein